MLFVRLGTASKLKLHAYRFIESAIVQRASLFGDIMSIVQVPTKHLMNLHALLERIRKQGLILGHFKLCNRENVHKL